MRRVYLHGFISVSVFTVSLFIGVIGYRVAEGMTWIDALENAAMILGGMGPAAPVQSTPGKLFAACYALFSGIVFLVAVGVLLAPLVHRVMHRFHMESTFKDR